MHTIPVVRSARRWKVWPLDLIAPGRMYTEENTSWEITTEKCVSFFERSLSRASEYYNLHLTMDQVNPAENIADPRPQTSGPRRLDSKLRSQISGFRHRTS